MERLAIAVRQPDIAQHIALAREHQVGIEIQTYGYDPGLLDGDWPVLLVQHRRLLQDFYGEIALHGAFMDMSPASIDQRVTSLARERYRLSLQIGTELGACYVVFHANYFPYIRNPMHLTEWTQRQVAFWADLAEEARRLGLVVTLENMWEPDPGIIARVVEEVGSPHLAACLDVGHVYLYSDSLPFSVWLDRLGEHLVYCHINNNRGLYDEHLPLDAEGGIVDYQAVLPALRMLPRSPLVCLEIDGLEELERSLRYLGR